MYSNKLWLHILSSRSFIHTGESTLHTTTFNTHSYSHSYLFTFSIAFDLDNPGLPPVSLLVFCPMTSCFLRFTLTSKGFVAVFFFFAIATLLERLLFLPLNGIGITGTVPRVQCSSKTRGHPIVTSCARN